MRIVFFGTPTFALPTLQIVMDRSEFEVIGVVSQPDRPQGRGHKLLPTPVKALAQQYEIPIWQPERLKRSPEVLQQLEDLRADAFVVVAYGQILSPQVLAMPRLGCINVHGSLLPAYRGAAPIQWAIANGEPETGITTMLMDAGMDTGPMLLKAKLAIQPKQTAADLSARLAPLGAELLVETLLKLDTGDLTLTPQEDHLATYAPLLSPAHFQLDWTRSALDLHNQIRAFHPNCFTQLRGERLKILATDVPSPTPASDPAAAQPGQIVAISKGKGFWLQTGSEPICVCQVQPAGKKAQSAWDVVNGLRLQIGEQLGDPTTH